MRLDGKGTAFTDPLYHLSAYGLQNPVVLECIERGFYGPGCPTCGASGKVRKWVWSGELAWHEEERPCPSCSGTKQRPDRPVHEADFGDPESLAFARQMFPGMKVEPHRYPCVRAVHPDRRELPCTCVLLS